MDISEKLKELRKKLKLSQAEVAERLGLAQSNYGLLENGSREITLSKLEKLAEVFGVSVGELLGLEGVQAVPNGEQASEIEALKREVESYKSQLAISASLLEALYESLPEEQKGKMKHIGTAIAFLTVFLNGIYNLANKQTDDKSTVIEPNQTNNIQTKSNTAHRRHQQIPPNPDHFQ